MNQPVLCYVSGPWAYFTTRKLSEQWGDDWDDAPYEHNAGMPYEPCWHNRPGARNNPEVKRGYKPGTQTPLEVGELCRCNSCVRDWNEDGTPKYEIVKVAWDGPYSTPAEDAYAGNSRYSVQAINRGDIAWLRHNEDGLPIHAGITLDEFIQRMKDAGGRVFREV